MDPKTAVPAAGAATKSPPVTAATKASAVTSAGAPSAAAAAAAASDIKAADVKTQVHCPVGHAGVCYAGRKAAHYAADSLVRCNVCGQSDIDTKAQYYHCDTCKDWDCCAACSAAQLTRAAAGEAIPNLSLNAVKIYEAFQSELKRATDSKVSAETFLASNTPAVGSAGDFVRKPSFAAKDARGYGDVQAKWKLTASETAKLNAHNFVVSDRLGAKSFGGAFARMYNEHIPVFVGADPILHAWHRSFDKILEDFEYAYLTQSLNAMLTAMLKALPAAASKIDSKFLPNAFKHVATFLGVAFGLLNPGKADAGMSGAPELSAAKTAVSEVAVMIRNLRAPPQKHLPFSSRPPDNIQKYTPCGHYTRTALLRAYFQAITWIARMDCVLDVRKPSESLQDLGCAALMCLTLTASGQTAVYKEFDNLLTVLFGAADNCSLLQLQPFLNDAKVASAADITSASMQLVWDALNKTEIGRQAINDKPAKESDVAVANFRGIRSIALMGARFTIDAFVMQNVTNHHGRRIPSSLDVAYAVFGNTASVPVLVDRMKLSTKPAVAAATATATATAAGGCGGKQKTDEKDQKKSVTSAGAASTSKPSTKGTADTKGDVNFESRSLAVPFRDGYEYAHQLVALRSIVTPFDTTPIAPRGNLWSTSLQTLWLRALKALSNPHSAHGTRKKWSPSALPSVALPDFRSRTDSDDDAGPRIGLAHTTPEDDDDSPVAAEITLAYPEFMRTEAFGLSTMNTQLASWSELRHDTVLYIKAGSGCETECDYPEGMVDPRLEFWRCFIALVWRARQLFASVARPKTVERVRDFLDCFVGILQMLDSIAATQVQEKPLSDKQKQFLKDIILEQNESGVSCPYTGWYPRLFYGDEEAFLREEYLVAGVWTNPKDLNTGDPGCNVHIGTGGVSMLIAAADNGKTKGMYCGPVYTRYEFLTPPNVVLSDEEWALRLKSNKNVPKISSEQEVYRVAGLIPGVKLKG